MKSVRLNAWWQIACNQQPYQVEKYLMTLSVALVDLGDTRPHIFSGIGLKLGVFGTYLCLSIYYAFCTLLPI